MNLIDLYTKGFCCFNNSSVFEPLESIIDQIIWYANPDKKTVMYTEKNEILQNALDDTLIMLSNQYVKNISPVYSAGYTDMWNGVDDGTDKWHNDGREGPNLFFILYFNSMDKDIGGGIGFRETQCQKETGFIWPKKYDILIGSQRPQYQHKVEPLHKPVERIVANFGFYVEGL